MSAPPGEEGVGRGYANYVLAVLFVVYVFNFVDRQVLSILIGPIKKDLGISDTVMGLLAGPAFALFYTLAGIPIALWADRANRITVIALSLTVWSGMTALSGLARSSLTFALARVGVGVGEAGGSPPSHSLISDYFPPERRATALALYANGIYIGSGCAFIFGAWIATQTDWRTVYYVLGILGILKGGRGIRFRVLGEIAIGWVTTPVIAGIITFIALFFLQNVFGIPVK